MMSQMFSYLRDNMWFSKKESKVTKLKYDNIYTVLNDELQRLHNFVNSSMKTGNADNATVTFRRIEAIQDALFLALKQQPASADQIRDLQETVAEMLLLTDTESK
jgi:hypothetical protein